MWIHKVKQEGKYVVLICLFSVFILFGLWSNRKRMPKKETVGIVYNIPSSSYKSAKSHGYNWTTMYLSLIQHKGNRGQYHSEFLYVPSIVSRNACLCFHVLPHFDHEQLLVRKKTKKSAQLICVKNFLHLS